MLRNACLLSLATVVCSAPAGADIILMAQSREISASAGDPTGGPLSEMRSTLAAGPFDESVEVIVGSHSGRATMSSMIMPHLVHGVATAAGAGDLGFPLGLGLGEATFSARFRVIEPTDYHFSAMFESSGSDAGGGVSFTGPSGPIFELVAIPGSPTSESFDTTGTLAPGIYDLVATIGASVFSPPGAGAAFGVTLDLPAPGATIPLLAALACATHRRR